MLNYMICLHENKNLSDRCRHLAKSYLKCRMDNGLMAKDDWASLGFSKKDDPST
ncbi:Cytochrome c oxidase assembly protein COX19 [Toxocara canis]|nr:Cytochrome c oxidase assembly protein COX19 [Toxocara canis]